MFTGIIAALARARSFEEREEGAVLTLETPFHDLAVGESVAVNGVCLTVTETAEDGSGRFFIGSETLRRTNLGTGGVGVLNLERALAPGERLSGHFVQGHVDGVASFNGCDEEGETKRLEFRLSRALGRYCVEKGSIALNGVSLTLNSVVDEADATWIVVHIIPHTWEKTNLSRLKTGDRVNVEVDIFSKYVERLCQPYAKQ